MRFRVKIGYFLVKNELIDLVPLDAACSFLACTDSLGFFATGLSTSMSSSTAFLFMLMSMFSVATGSWMFRCNLTETAMSEGR